MHMLTSVCHTQRCARHQGEIEASASLIWGEIVTETSEVGGQGRGKASGLLGAASKSRPHPWTCSIVL